MKIATNVTREYLGGISRSNINFMDSLPQKGGGIIGLELNTRRYMQGPTIFQHLSPDWFSHHIVNIHDIPISKAIKSSKTLKDLEKNIDQLYILLRKFLRRTNQMLFFLMAHIMFHG